jgi:superfamily II DNA or RNA helicase
MPAVLTAADRRLTSHREGGMPDAGGLVIASDQATARSYAAILRTVSGEQPAVVLSDDGAAAGASIAEFARSEQRWMVAVRMVSEGVDVPRLAVGVYATTTSTPLFFAQAVGRFVRARTRGEIASVFLPSAPRLLGFAAELELQRDHVLGRPVRDDDDIFAAEDDLLARAQAGESASAEEQGGPFEALGSQARFDHALYDGSAFGHEGEVQVGSEEEMDFLGIPGLLEPSQMKDLLRQRQADRAKVRKPAPAPADSVEQVTTHEQLAVMRRELNGLVAAWNHRTGQPHGVTHAALRKECSGPAAAIASADQLKARIDRIREWAIRKSS